MNYYVNLGGIIICGITGVSDEMGREINAYDSIGQGKFSVPDTAGLRTWTIECQLTEINKPFVKNWTAARKIFAGFDTLLNTKNPSRFIFTSQYRTDSLSAYLRSYTKTEKFPGVYDVSIQVVEYKPVGIKTTDVPYIQRPGKVPDPPKVVVLNNKTTPYTVTQKTKPPQKPGKEKEDTTTVFTDQSQNEDEDGGKEPPKTTTINPATLNQEDQYAYSVANAIIPLGPTIKKAAEKVGTAISTFMKKVPKNAIGGNDW